MLETTQNLSVGEVFIEIDRGEFIQFDMTLPLQILFDNAFYFVSKIDLEE